MKLYFAIYLLGSIVSLLITLITLSLSKTGTEMLMNLANDKISERLNEYERINIVNPYFYCVINFLFSWVQVGLFLYTYIPSRFFIKINFYRFFSIIFIWIAEKTSVLAHALVNKHNQIIKDYNEKNNIKN